MTETIIPSVSRRRSLLVWLLFCIIAGIVFLAYTFTSLAAGRGELVMPLDDVYIHFQYARQMALGQPYVYNPGLSPTSGATSFLYPYILAIGYLVGFQGLNLGLWAMLVGMMALAVSTWLVYQLILRFDVPGWLAILVAILFALTGPVSWHFMSGMETGLIVMLTLATLYFVIPPQSKDEQGQIRWAILAAIMLALIRPEGGLLAALAMGALWGIRRKSGIRANLPLVIPLLAVGVQPLVNLLMTGSAVASGNAAKSIFGIVPFYWDGVIRRILENWGRMWVEFIIPPEPWQSTSTGFWGIGVLALAGLVVLIWRRQHRLIGLMVMSWLLVGTLAISTLDTAFWHFKRYQMPFIALLFPFAALGLSLVIGRVRQLRGRYPGFYGLHEGIAFGVAFLVVSTVITSVDYWAKYFVNVGYVYAQPLQMARWLHANTPPDAVVAVHDTGMMRYMGGRTTIDMVGLTTPGAADYWRNGPGSVAEFLIQERPDYIASYGYGHGFGLGMLADTDLYGDPLASFPVQLDPNYNVALAADFQGIYKPDWHRVPLSQFSTDSLQPYGNDFIFGWQGLPNIPSSYVDVADVRDEARANYQWRNNKNLPGFPTEVHQLDYVKCAIDDCNLIDGGRLINGEESFDLHPFYDSGSAWDVVLVTRVNPMYAGTIDVYANDVFIGTRWIPAIPGKWLEIPTLIPETIARNPTHIRIVPHIPDGYYMPYVHMAYSKVVEARPETTVSTFQDGAIVLASAQIEYQSGAAELPINFEWYTDGSAEGDYKVFVHVLDENDQIVAQTDTYPGNGTLPPGNWLPGILRDTIMVDLGGIPPGSYRVAMGLYNPYTFERLQAEGGDDQGRFFIGDVEIR